VLKKGTGSELMGATAAKTNGREVPVPFLNSVEVRAVSVSVMVLSVLAVPSALTPGLA